MINSRCVLMLVLSCSCVAGLGCSRSSASRDDAAARRSTPTPTEHRLDVGAESRNRSLRRAWIESMHKTADGVDWREIERANGRAEQQRRNVLGRERRAAGAAGQWSEVGSKNLAGRMHCAVVGPDGQTLYAGSALGGVWRGTLNGQDWVPLGDNLFGGSHELLVLPPENPGENDVIVVTTDGGDVHVSRNDGVVWETPTGTGSFSWIRGVAVLDDAPRTILLYARGPATGWTPAIYASIDYGRTFAPRWQASSNWDGYMWVPRSGPDAVNTVYVLHQGQLRRSTDGGFNCPVIGTVDATAARGVLSGSEAGAPRLYAAVSVAGQWELHRSDDAGVAWTYKHDINDFWQTLCASVNNAEVVMWGGVEVWRSANGGTSFNKINGWAEYYGNPTFKLHADIPGLHCWPHPDDPTQDLWYISTDGGIYRSDNQAAGVYNISQDGLGVSQYYSTLTSSAQPLRIVAGAQDQGYQRGIYLSPDGPGPSTPFTQLISGDYGHLTSTDGSHELVYSTYPGFVLIQEGESGPQLHTADFPAGAANSWLPPVVAHPEDPNRFFFCGDQLYVYNRSGNFWFPSVHSTQDFAAGSANYLTAMAFAPTDSLRAYAVTDAGQLFWSTNQGVNWTQGSGAAPAEHYFYGNAIAVHPDNPLEVAVGGSGYSAPGVMRSVNGGVTWQAEVTGLPSTLVYALVYSEESGDLYAGTETGAYRWHRDTGVWENIMANDAPITIYWSVESVQQGQTIRYGTYGRGIWDYAPNPVIEPCIEHAACADANPVDGLRDDSCMWWSCDGGTCAGTAVQFADLGGPNGSCTPDQAADGNDRFHALNCFSDIDTLGNAGAYACEDTPPSAYNVDAGGAFGACCPDGVCDANDAFHALSSFEGLNPCRCDADGGLNFACPCAVPTDPPGNPVLCPNGPQPSYPVDPSEGAGRQSAGFELTTTAPRVRPRGTLEIDVLLHGDLPDLRGYQLHVAVNGGTRGTLEINDLAINDRKDQAFAGRAQWQAFNVSTGQLLAGMDTAGVAVRDGAYLGTVIVQASRDASGTFAVGLRADLKDPSARTFLIPTPTGERIDLMPPDPLAITIQRH